jgi:hypothetical protein
MRTGKRRGHSGHDREFFTKPASNPFLKKHMANAGLAAAPSFRSHGSPSSACNSAPPRVAGGAGGVAGWRAD